MGKKVPKEMPADADQQVTQSGNWKKVLVTPLYERMTPLRVTCQIGDERQSCDQLESNCKE